MFSYRHAFHAGNHADVLKHTVLIAALQYLTEKDAALTVLDTHAGAGLYRLDGDYARTSGEAGEGILRLAPTWVPRSFLQPGRRLKLHPQDYYALGKHRGNLASWTAWVAPKTIKPAEAARLVGMAEDQLRQVNNIPKGMLVKAGSTLLVPRGAHRTEDVAEHIADHATLALAPDVPPQRQARIKIGKKGDTVAAVASRYRMRPDQLAQLNGVAVGARFKPGQTVTVLVTTKVTRMANKAAPAKRLNKPAATARQRKPAN